MAKRNGKTDARFLEKDDLEHELPAGEGEDVATSGVNDGEGAAETEKLKAERDALIERTQTRSAGAAGVSGVCGGGCDQEFSAHGRQF
jgi:hypothetical protein